MKTVTFSENSLRTALESCRELSNNARVAVLNHLMKHESERTPRQIAEVKKLRKRIEIIQAKVLPCIGDLERTIERLDEILSPTIKDEDDDDET